MVIVEIRTRGVKRATAKFKRIEATIRKGFSKEIIEKGYRKALQIIPHDTGAMERGLQTITTNPMSGKLRLNQPNNKVSGTTKPYHLWMHGLGKYNTAHAIYRGDPHFMFTTRDYMEKEALKLIKKRIKNTK